jgi:type I restriction enzyme, S subunit
VTTLETGLHYPLQLDKLPESWEAGYVGDFATNIEPGFASGEHNREGTGVPHLRPMNIDRSGKIDLNIVKYVDPAKNVRRLRCGDVLFNNTNSPELIGKTTAITKQMDWAFSNHMTRIAFSERVDPKFAAYQLHFLWMTGYFLHKCVKHVNQASVSSTTLARTVPFIRPPLDQQKAIVAEIEKQFSRLDDAVANLKRVKANLKRYKAAVLKAAVEGKLTEEWRKVHPDVEPASELLKRILAERRPKWNGKGKYREPEIPETANLPALPRGWTVTSVSQLLTEPLCNGISVKGSDAPPGVRALRLSAMSDTGFDYSEVRYLPLSEDDVEDLWIVEGDFFISRGNGSLHLVGRGTSAQQPSDPTIFPDTMIRLRLAKYIRESGWLQTIWSSRLVRSQIERKVKTTAGIYKIAQPEVEQITIPVPPLLEQERIVTEVEQRFSVIATVEAQMAANFQRAERLRQTILQNAFNGTLYHHFRRPDDSGVNNTRR